MKTLIWLFLFNTFQGCAKCIHLLLLSFKPRLQLSLLFIQLFNLSGQDIICIHGFNFLFNKKATKVWTQPNFTFDHQATNLSHTEKVPMEKGIENKT